MPTLRTTPAHAVSTGARASLWPGAGVDLVRSDTPRCRCKETPIPDKLAPRNWPNWLRIVTLVVSGVWIVSIPLLFSARLRMTWMPWVGVGSVILLVVGIAVPADDDVATAEPTTVVTATVASDITESEPTVATETLKLTPTPTPTVTVSPTPTSRPETTPTPELATPEPTPQVAPTPVATASPNEVFRIWYRLQGYPDAAYTSVLEFVDAGCEFLREGATIEAVFLVVLVKAGASQYEMTVALLGAGIEAFCPDQSYKFSR